MDARIGSLAFTHASKKVTKAEDNGDTKRRLTPLRRHCKSLLSVLLPRRSYNDFCSIASASAKHPTKDRAVIRLAFVSTSGTESTFA